MRKGIRIDKTRKQIIFINFFIILFTTAPFLIVDALFSEYIQFMTYDNVKGRLLSHCYMENANTTRELLSWLEIDEGIRIFTIVYAATMLVAAFTIQQKRVSKVFLLYTYGTFGFLLYQLVWHIEGITIYSEMLSRSIKSPIQCASQFEPYMIVSSSLGTILIILDMIFTFLTPKYPEQEDYHDDQSYRTKGIKINKTAGQVTLIQAIVVVVTMLPFMIGHMVLMSGTTLCTLDRWLEIDQQSKSIIMVFIITMAVATNTVSTKKTASKLMLITGYVLFGFFLYHLIFLIYGITLFFSSVDKEYDYNLCRNDKRLEPYLTALSILGIIINVANLVISFLRPVQQEPEHEEHEMHEAKSSSQSLGPDHDSKV